MKRLTSPAAVLIVVVALVAMLYGMFNAAAETIGTPYDRAGAAATATAIAPAVRPTEMYNENVVPLIQEAEAASAVDLTNARTENTMNVERSVSLLKMAAVFSVMSVIVVSSLTLLGIVVLIGVLMLLGVIWRTRQVVQLTPVAALPGRGKPVQFPGLVYTPSTGARHALEPGPADEAHAQAIITKQVESIQALTGIVNGGYRFSYRGDGNKHPANPLLGQ